MNTKDQATIQKRSFNDNLIEIIETKISMAEKAHEQFVEELVDINQACYKLSWSRKLFINAAEHEVFTIALRNINDNPTMTPSEFITSLQDQLTRHVASQSHSTSVTDNLMQECLIKAMAELITVIKRGF